MFVTNDCILGPRVSDSPPSAPPADGAYSPEAPSLPAGPAAAPPSGQRQPLLPGEAPALCGGCGTQVGMQDSEEVFHFFNVIPSHA